MAFGLSSPVIHILIASSPLWVPVFLAVVLPNVTFDWTFTPRAIIYSNRVAPIFLAPFAKPETIWIGISRVTQCALLSYMTVAEMGKCWLGWIALALIRSITGYLLTRSVGWAYPSLFSHYALYESASGFGPVLAAYLVLQGPSVLRNAPPLVVKYASHRYAITLLVGITCWLECRPWTYGTAIFAVLPISLVPRIFGQRRGLPHSTVEKQLEPGPALDRYFTSSLAVLVPWLVIYHMISATRLPLLSTEEPLLDILMLSFPRPVPIETSVSIIETTASSFVPYLSPAVTLSFFTHAADHEALRIVHDRIPQTTLHVDTDSHPDDNNGHYLHLAEAFRWIMEDKSKRGEWVMLLEDDFPICHGDRGWAVITTVMAQLEKDRVEGNIRSGFIGTGGSGIILHKSYLPTMIFLLRSLSAADSRLHPDVIRRAPDEIIHDCILGRRYSFCERHAGDQRKLLISSRLVLDHIGGMATTSSGKPGNTDKWRCGWRHAFHGDDAVEVVVV